MSLYSFCMTADCAVQKGDAILAFVSEYSDILLILLLFSPAVFLALHLKDRKNK